jgi:predicted hotdog family 3-hydroxylacyl-ACP dehydratase
MTRLPRIVDVVPHRPPMLLLDEVTQWTGARVECCVKLHGESPFVEGGRVASTVGVEYMAQCVAAFVGLEARERGEPIPLGYLVGSRDISLPSDGFRVGDELHVAAEPVWGGQTLGSFNCTIQRAGAVIATGALSVYRAGPGDLSRT